MYKLLHHNRVIQKVCPEEKSEGKFIKTGISTSQGTKGSLVVVLKQV
jgi:hypothetical protein